MAARPIRARRRVVVNDPADPRVLITAKVRQSLRTVYTSQEPSGNAWLETTLEALKKRRQRKAKK